MIVPRKPRTVLAAKVTAISFRFFFNETATTEIYPLSLHDALPIYRLRAARRSFLHEDRHDSSRGNVYRRRAHGRSWLGRSGERRWLRRGARDGTRTHPRRTGSADRALDSFRALEQRGDRPQRRARLRRATRGAARQGRAGGFGKISGAEMARDD